MSFRLPRQSLAASLVGSFSEAFAEVRIHRTRVLLSLIGVAVAVTAITTVVGLGAIAEKAVTESSERNGGRPASLSVNAYRDDGAAVDSAVLATAFDAAMKRYDIRYHSTILNGQHLVQFADGAAPANTLGVDVPYGIMRLVSVDQGSWFTARDENRLAPAVIINEVLWAKLGSPTLSTHPTLQLLGSTPITAVVIGVVKNRYDGEPPSLMMLASAFQSTADPEVFAAPQPQFEAWVPPSMSSALRSVLERDLKAVAGPGVHVEVSRQDYLAHSSGDPLAPFKIVVGGVAVLVLFLGALGLVNISLVTVRQRIREIGIRRSFGATAGRVFFAVMMESVVATLAAGVVGVALSIVIVENPWVQALISRGVTELPPFPIEAAILGLVAATAVGALAGLLPALVAVRVKVIDAIRY
jgi:putative ABC transport system permease protein